MNNKQARVTERALNAIEAHDFQGSVEAAGAVLQQVFEANTETPDRTVIVTAPGGRLLAYVRGGRGWFTAPISVRPLQPPPEIEFDDDESSAVQSAESIDAANTIPSTDAREGADQCDAR